jgi:hypothetical protein
MRTAAFNHDGGEIRPAVTSLPKAIWSRCGHTAEGLNLYVSVYLCMFQFTHRDNGAATAHKLQFEIKMIKGGC